MIDRAKLTALGALSRHNAAEAPDALCLRFEGRDTTFAEFDRHGDQVANALDAVGARRVAYLGKNADYAFEAFLGCARAGAIFGPINWRLAAPEVAAILHEFGADLLFVGPEFYGEIDSVRDRLPEGMHIVAMEGGRTDWPAFEQWRDAQPADHPETAKPEDVVLMLFTSGTTGLPKGAMLSHENIFGQRRETAPYRMGYDFWDENEVNLVAMPFAHIGGIGWWILGFVNQAPSIVCREFNPVQALEMIEREKVSRLFIVPAALQFMVQHPRAREIDFSHVRHIVYGAAPMPLELLREALKVIPSDYSQAYGMTETTGTISLLPPEDHTPEGSPRMRSAGRAMPGSEIKILDPEGNELPRGEIGEVAIRSGNNMVGYWNKPEETAKTLSRDNWLRTGDAGYMDEDGYVYIHDRIKDMIVSGAENVYPAEVENAIYGHPDVAEVAVIGVPDERWGEAVKAIVTPRENRSVDPGDIIAWTRERLAHFKCPKTVDVIEAMPRNPSGKLLKRELRKPYWEGQERQVH
ncbi:MAG: fatty acid--CoA ligase [Pseudomonadota bacterium]